MKYLIRRDVSINVPPTYIGVDSIPMDYSDKDFEELKRKTAFDDLRKAKDFMNKLKQESLKLKVNARFSVVPIDQAVV